MNLNDYEKKDFSTYAAFAETIRFILEKALLAADNLPRPQSVQCRAKGIESLRRRLAEEGKLDTQTLELDRRGLAGAVPVPWLGKRALEKPTTCNQQGDVLVRAGPEAVSVSRGAPAQQRVSQLHLGVRCCARQIGKVRRRYGGGFCTGDSPELSR